MCTIFPLLTYLGQFRKMATSGKQPLNLKYSYGGSATRYCGNFNKYIIVLLFVDVLMQE